MKGHSAALTKIQKRFLYITTAVLWLSGMIWLCLPEISTGRPSLLKIHGAAAMVFLMVFGMLYKDHIRRGWKREEQRPSGLSLVTLCSVLVVTGWGLYYLGGESIRQWNSTIHTVFGVALPALIALHVWLSRRPVKRPPPNRP